MDPLLQQLQGRAFSLVPEAFEFLSRRREELIHQPPPALTLPGVTPDGILRLLNRHRRQFDTEEYLKSRIENPTSGTVDHIHAEITSHNAAALGAAQGVSGYYLELLRAAGHLHDCERSFPAKMTAGEETARKDPQTYIEFKKKHAENSAFIAGSLLKELEQEGCVFPEGFKEDLQYLIRRHELGGEEEERLAQGRNTGEEPPVSLNRLNDILTDADSISYMDANILTNWDETGRNEALLAGKVRYMYSRMTPGGKAFVYDSILEAPSHILGPRVPPREDLLTIRKILLRECRR
jgi:hypothetical protein